MPAPRTPISRPRLPFTLDRFWPSTVVSTVVLACACGTDEPYGSGVPDAAGGETGEAPRTVTPPEPAEFPSACVEEGADVVQGLLDQMTREETCELLGGTDFVTSAIPRLGIPSLDMADGPHGIRGGNQWPCLVAAACSFDAVLEEEVGAAMAKEFRRQGKNVTLGPMVNLIRDGRWGRSAETYSEDPYLAGKLAAARIRGIQSVGVIADVKHYTANNIETGRENYPATLPERTLRERYLPAFKLSVQEGAAWSVMAAYNQVNGEACSHNAHLLRDILKEEWGFPGFVLSDWGAAYGDTLGSALGGLDIEMPVASAFGVEALLGAVDRGEVDWDLVVDKARRVLTAAYCAGMLEPGYGRVAYDGIENDPEQQALLARASRATLVLAKNEGAVLPIDRSAISSVAVIGPYAAEPRYGVLGSGHTTGPTVPPLQGIQDKLEGSGVTVVTEDWHGADYVVVFVGTDEPGEWFDRENLDLPTEISDTLTVDQNALVGEVLADKPDRTVVVYTGGSFSVAGTWSSAPAVLIAMYPGGDQGNAIADALFGDYNPGGKLSITFPQTADQVPPWGTDVTLYSTYEAPEEGRGWPYYEHHDLEPLFPFGHGLSYTTFEHDNLRITPTRAVEDEAVTVEVDVRNSGAVAGDEVVQLYVADPEASVPRRIKDLRGFLRVHLEPNEQLSAAFTLTAADLAFFDDTINEWVAEPGTFQVLIGSSSRDIRLTGEFEVVP